MSAGWQYWLAIGSDGLVLGRASNLSSLDKYPHKRLIVQMRGWDGEMSIAQIMRGGEGRLRPVASRVRKRKKGAETHVECKSANPRARV